MSKDCQDRKYGNNYKKFKTAEKAIEGDEDDVVLCLLMMESEKENVKKKM